MKLNRLKSIVNQLLRESCQMSGKYMIDPFYHYTPEEEIIIDLKNKSFNTSREGDDIEVYYSMIIQWFHEVLLKEGIPLGKIDSAIIKITPKAKECIIETKNKKYSSKEIFKIKKQYYRNTNFE